MKMKLFLIVLLAHLQQTFSGRQINGTVGQPLLWPCTHTTKDVSAVSWHASDQPPDKSLVCYNAVGDSCDPRCGSHSPVYKNLSVFCDEIPSGNVSLCFIKPNLMQDNVSYEVILTRGEMDKQVYTCKVTLHLSVAFQTPTITVNGTKATCRARGGYPEPVVRWTGENESGPVTWEPVNKTVTPENQTFSISSTVDITDITDVTCSIYNPTSNKTSTAGLAKGVLPAFLFDHGHALNLDSHSRLLCQCVFVQAVVRNLNLRQTMLGLLWWFFSSPWFWVSGVVGQKNVLVLALHLILLFKKKEVW
ncbi:uncharacterized protein LOC128757668 isoform X2 [Synchiropus splendidus]|uniref:uncharacterized protein LOC128757668 isoform X2 n=1 Tax=Synchiropus splendidus TaxID=270530 RepID=UPI00237D6D66|nr:uncharacterized protein LOC128757668 isoform X2 [Synchiropus splendidus]